MDINPNVDEATVYYQNNKMKEPAQKENPSSRSIALSVILMNNH
jgi:hypothetical protein